MLISAQPRLLDL